jgi:hypothetical protein
MQQAQLLTILTATIFFFLRSQCFNLCCRLNVSSLSAVKSNLALDASWSKLFTENLLQKKLNSGYEHISYLYQQTTGISTDSEEIISSHPSIQPLGHYVQ